MIVAFIVSFAILIGMACVESLRRKMPINYIMLGLFTVAESYMIAAYTSRFDPIDVSFDYIILYFVYLQFIILIHTGRYGGRNHNRGVRGSDDFRLPNQMGLYHDGRHSIYCVDSVIRVRTGGHDLPGTQNDSSLLIVWSSALQYLPDLRHSNDDGRHAQAFD